MIERLDHRGILAGLLFLYGWDGHNLLDRLNRLNSLFHLA